MSDNNLRLQVILNAVDKLTRPFRSAQASSKELAAAIQQSRASLKALDSQAARIDGFRKVRTQLEGAKHDLAAARQKVSELANAFSAASNPTKKQAKELEQAKRRASQLKDTFDGLRQSAQRQRDELSAAGISTKNLSSAQRTLRQNADETRQALDRQQKSLKRLGEQQARMNAVREQYSRRLEVRDRIAGAGATTAAAGAAMGAPVVAAVRSYASMEDAMKGVAKQVNGLRDDNGNRTKQFYEMQDAIKAASEQLPMENGAIDYAALVEGGARMGVINQDDPFEDQKRDLLAFASTAAKAATAFELPADELAEGLGKIAQLYKVPTRNIEQLGDALNYLDDNAMSKGGDIINVLQRMGGVADRLDFRKAAALGSTFLSLGAAPEIAASASNAMVRELSIATMQSKRFFEGMDLLKLNPAEIEKQMTTDAMGTIQRVLEKVNKLPQDKRLSAMTMIFGKEFGDDAAKLANNLLELQRQLKLTAGADANGSMQKESDINKDSLSAQWLLVKTGAQNAFSSLGETLRQPLMDIMSMVKGVTGALRRWVEQNPVLAGTLMKVAAATAAITVGLGTLAVAVAAVLGPIAVIRFALSMLAVKALPSTAAAVTRTGGVLRLLVSGPLAVLRVALFSVGGLLGALLSPIGLVVAALAGVAMVVWKYWQPISAFLGGVVEGFKAAAEPILSAFAPLMPIFQWVGDKVRELWGWFTDLLTPVKSTAAELQSAASMGRLFGEMLAEGLNVALHPLESLKSGVVWLLDKLGLVNKEAASARLPNQTPATLGGNGSVILPPGGFPAYAGMYDTGGNIPRGQFGIVGENGPEIINGPVNVTSRRRTAALASVVAGMMGVAAAPADAAPLHPFSLPVKSGAVMMGQGASAQPVFHVDAPTQIIIQAQPGQNAQDIAREVARQLDERDRRIRAKARSNYSDQGGYDE
ncbi:phage tail tape measure protein, TP901 family, core region [Escherichia coli 5-172-05_S3_C1]|uniref:phage tail tape measure protein n=1 Tax=Escherichia coli TaxID=562 RepID=UPI0004D3C5CE|nr:phage tail tape measure protein [Escherichia coli]KEL56212.1 phage tail tape measure protein, TP901 family, core region [Escherichia coli 5-172-05_S3_C1]